MDRMLPCDRLTPLPPSAPARPPKAHAAARIDWSIQDLPHKMATSPRYLIALYKEGIASKDAVITQLRAERHTLEAQIKSANGMETLLQNELEAAIRVQNDLKEKLTTSLQAAKEKLTAAEAAYGKKVDHLSEAMHALTLAQMDLQASQRERRTVETINTSLSNELAAKDGDILALKEALRIAQRAVDEVNAPTLQKRLENTEKELKSVRAALRSAQKAPPTPEDTDWCLCNGTGQYVKRRWGDGWVSEVTTPCPAPKHSSTKRKAYAQAGGVFRMTPEPSKKPVPAPAQVLPRAHVAGDLLKTILQDDLKSDPPTSYDPYVKDFEASTGADKVPTTTETYKKPAVTVSASLTPDAPQKLLVAYIENCLRCPACKSLGRGQDGTCTQCNVQTPDPEPKVDDDDIDTLLDSMLNSKETSTDDVLPAPLLNNWCTVCGRHTSGDLYCSSICLALDGGGDGSGSGGDGASAATDIFILPALLKALDVVGKKAFSDDLVIESFAKGFVHALKTNKPKEKALEECNVQ